MTGAKPDDVSVTWIMLAHMLLVFIANDEVERTISKVEYFYRGSSDSTAVALENNQYR